MNKFLLFFFLTVFCLYVLFSRHPDFFDGLTTVATIQYVPDSATQAVKASAVFTLNGVDSFHINPNYLFRKFTNGERITIIYENANPQKAAVYSWWGYWLTWKELLACLVGYFVLFQAARSIVHNPSQESIKELEDYAQKPKVKKRKYK